MTGPGLERVVGLHRLHARLRLALDERLAAHHGIDFEDFMLLHTLDQGGAMSLASLGRDLGSALASLLKRTRPLEKIGLVQCEGALSQRRISLAPAGRRVLGSAEGTVEEVWETSVAQLPADRVDALGAALKAGLAG